MLYAIGRIFIVNFLKAGSKTYLTDTAHKHYCETSYNGFLLSGPTKPQGKN